MNEQITTAQTAERSQFLVRDFNDVTVRYVLWYPGALRADALAQATKAVVDSIDVLHGSLHLHKGKLLWDFHTDLQERDYFRHEVVEGAMRQLPYSMALESIEFEDPVKLRCILVEDAHQSAVILLVSHLVADGGDSKYLLRKLLEAYDLILRTGTADGLVVKNGSRDPAQVYAHLDKKTRRSLYKNPMSGPKNEFPFADPTPGKAMLLRQTVSRELLTNARNRDKSLDATANDLILTAIYRAFAATEGVDDTKGLCVSAMMDLRRHCPGGDSQGITNLAGALYTELQNGVQGSFHDTLSTIVAQTRQDKRDPLAGLMGVPLMHLLVGKLPVPLLLRAADQVYGSMSLGLTNMGNLLGEALALNGVMPTDALFGGPRKKKPGVQISVLSLDGNCSLVIAGDYTQTDVPQLDDFLTRIVAELEAYANGH